MSITRLSPSRLPVHIALALAVLVVFAAPPVMAGPDDDAFQFAEGLFIRKDYESAIEEYQGFLKTYAKSPKAAVAMYRIGECRSRLGDHEKAVVAFEAALAAHPKSTETALGAFNLGRSYLALGKHAEAATAFGTAAAAGDAKVREEALVGQAEALVTLQKLPEAADVLTAFLKDFPQSTHAASVLYSLGWTELELKRHAAAETHLRELLKAYPDSPNAKDARLALSDALVALERYDAAAELLAPLGKTDEQAALRLSWVHFRAGRRAEAAAAFADFATRYPKAPMRPVALYNVGICHYDLKQYKEAVAAFEQLRTDYPDSDAAADSRLFMGISHFELGEHAKAQAILTAVTADPMTDAKNRPAALFVLAESARAAGDSKTAVATYGTLVKDFPDSPNVNAARYSLATLQAETDLDAARATLTALLAAKPSAEIEAEARFAMAEYSYRQKKFDVAAAEFAALAKADPAPARVLYRLGWVQYELGKFAEAQAAFTRLAAAESDFRSEAQFMAGRAAESAGQSAAAITAYQATVALPTAGEFADKAYYRLAYLLEPAAAEANLAAYLKQKPTGEYRHAMRLKLAESLFKADKAEAAEKHYRALIADKPDADTLQAANYGLGWCRLQAADTAGAAAAFAAVGAQNPASQIVRDAILQRAEIAYKAEDLKAAEPLFASLAAGEFADRQAERGLYMQAWCRRRLAAEDGAAPQFAAVLTRFPKSEFAADAGIRLAEAQRRAGDVAAARRTLEQVREQLPADLREEHLHLYADTLVEAKDWKTLMAVCKTLATDFPDSSHAYLVHFRLGLANRELGLLDAAEEEFRQTMALTDTIEAAQAQFNIAAIYTTREQHADAAKQYLRIPVLYDYPELSPRALYHAIDSFHRAGPDYDRRARSYLKELQEKYPDSDWAKKAAALLAE